VQFEIDSANSTSFAPVIPTSTATVAPGATAGYKVTLPSSATSVSVSCLNLPAGAKCSYSATSGTLSVATAANTPAGNWQVTVVFAETVPVAAAAAFLLSVGLLPLGWIQYRSGRSRTGYLYAIGLLSLSVVLITSCGGGGKGSTTPPPTTTRVTSSVSLTLNVK
jgi:hypothetical protein